MPADNQSPQLNSLYIFWTGNNPITPNRELHIQRMKEICGCEVVLVTPENLSSFILPEHPLHPAYRYLSFTHRSDYLRCYFMHFYGGGYSDIKRIDFNWQPFLRELEGDETLWAIGYPEQSPTDIALGAYRYNELTKSLDKVMGLTSFIFKPGTPLTSAWLEQTEHTLDRYCRRLKRHPAKCPQDFRYKRPRLGFSRFVSPRKGSSYPLEWSQILGDILHPLSYENSDKIRLCLPRVNTIAYR